MQRPPRLRSSNNWGTRRRRTRRSSAYRTRRSLARRTTRAYSDARGRSSVRRSARSPITWSPWSIREDITPRVEAKISEDSSPVPDRATIRIPWQDLRHLRIRIYNDQPPQALRIMADYGISASTKLRAPDVDYHTAFDLARIAKARKCLSRFLGLRSRAFIIIEKARDKYLSYIERINQNLMPCLDLGASTPVDQSSCLLQPRSKPKGNSSRSCQSCANTPRAPPQWRPLPDLSIFDELQNDSGCQRMCIADDISQTLQVGASVDMFSYLREFVVCRSRTGKPPDGPCRHALCWICGVWFRKRLSRRSWLLIMRFYLPRVVDFPLMSTAALVPPHLWPDRTGVHSEPQLPPLRDDRYCASCSVS